VDVRRGAAKLPHAVSLARFERLRSVTFRHEHYVSSIPTGARISIDHAPRTLDMLMTGTYTVVQRC